jgi:hypothetical protein
MMTGRQRRNKRTSPGAALLAGLIGAVAIVGGAADLPAADRSRPANEADASPWRALAPGLELAVFTVGPADIQVLRADPERWRTVALALSAVGGGPRTARAWGEEFRLTAVINAGLFAADLKTHIGYFRTGRHVDSGLWIQRDYRQAACFEPREPDLPRFVLKDLDAHDPADFADRYDIVVQNIRLIGKPGRNRWPRDTRPWAEACLGEDDRGRLLWIHCRHPLSMHEFNEILLGLPLGLVAAQHLEGGRQAQLWVDIGTLAADGGQPPPPRWSAPAAANVGWPVPNVLGLVPR